jgi:hypothetical protein
MKKRNLIKRFVLFLIACMVSAGCAIDQFETVPEKTARVLLVRPYDFWNREAGVNIVGPLKTGKHNHGAGPCVGYDIDISIQRRKMTAMEIKVADHINLKVFPEISWRMIPSAVDLAVVHYLPSDAIFIKKDDNPPEAFVPSTLNQTEIVNVPIEVIFDRNVRPYAEEVIRDFIDQFPSKEIKPEAMKMILPKLITRLQGIKIPKIKITESGEAIFPDVQVENGRMKYDGLTICILDVIDIQGVTVRYQNPDSIQNKIDEIGEWKARVIGLNAELDQWKIKKQTRIDEAMQARLAAINIKLALEANPHLRSLRRLKKFRLLAEEAEEGNNTEVWLVPTAMMVLWLPNGAQI